MNVLGPAACFFSYRDISVEVQCKIASLNIDPSILGRSLLAEMSLRGMPSHDLHRIERLLEALSVLPFDRVYSNYLGHPIRVAAAFARDLRGGPRYRDIALALCHNFRETGIDGQSAIEAEFLWPEASSFLDTLWTDRSKERDPSYLDSYYEGISSSPGNLLILKGHDKLDNFLSYAIYDIDEYHKSVVTNWVLPLLQEKARPLSEYLGRVVDFVFDDEIRRSFRASER